MRCQGALDNGLVGAGGKDYDDVCPPMK